MNNIKIRVIDCHIAYYNKQKNDWEFLLLKRSNNKIYPGIWQGVTGKIDGNEIPHQTWLRELKETLNEAAARELKEETNLIAEKMWSIDKVNMFYDAQNNIMNLIPVFGVLVSSKNVTLSEEHSEYKWCDIDETIKLLTWEQQKKGVHIFYQMLKENNDRLKILEIIIK